MCIQMSRFKQKCEHRIHCVLLSRSHTLGVQVAQIIVDVGRGLSDRSPPHVLTELGEQILDYAIGQVVDGLGDRFECGLQLMPLHFQTVQVFDESDPTVRTKTICYNGNNQTSFVTYSTSACSIHARYSLRSVSIVVSSSRNRPLHRASRCFVCNMLRLCTARA